VLRVGEPSTTAAGRGGGRLTAAVSVLALVSVCNALWAALQLAVGGQHQPTTLVLAAWSTLGAAFTAWALIRLRARRSESAAVPARPPPVEDEAPPVFAIGAWSERLPAWLIRAVRVGRWVLALGLTAAAAITIVDQWSTLQAAVDRLSDPNWHWLKWAIYAEAISTVAYAWMFLLLLRSGGVRLRLGTSVALTLAGNALVVTLPAGLAWATAFSFGQLRRRGVPRGLALGIPVLSTFVSIGALLALLVVGVDLAGAKGPAASFQPAALAVTAGLGVALLAAVVLTRTGKLPALRERLAGASVGISRRLVAAGFAPALLNWVFDCGCLACSILAVSGHVPWQGVLVAYAVGQIGANLPITPGGIGVVEGTMSVLLVAYGMHSATALAAVLLYRIISFWSLVPLGWVLVGALTRRRRTAAIVPAPAPARSSSDRALA
jgi:uncharacterized membrane protein YbhN (UPF0104 family)